MGIWCKKCGRFVEPTKEAMKNKICGFCSGEIPEDTKECYDGSPCSEPLEDCSTSTWL